MHIDNSHLDTNYSVADLDDFYSKTESHPYTLSHNFNEPDAQAEGSQISNTLSQKERSNFFLKQAGIKNGSVLAFVKKHYDDSDNFQVKYMKINNLLRGTISPLNRSKDFSDFALEIAGKLEITPEELFEQDPTAIDAEYLNELEDELQDASHTHQNLSTLYNTDIFIDQISVAQTVNMLLDQLDGLQKKY